MFLLSSAFSYIYIPHGNVEMHLWRDRIYNNHIIAHCPQNAPV